MKWSNAVSKERNDYAESILTILTAKPGEYTFERKDGFFQKITVSRNPLTQEIHLASSVADNLDFLRKDHTTLLEIPASSSHPDGLVEINSGYSQGYSYSAVLSADAPHKLISFTKDHPSHSHLGRIVDYNSNSGLVGAAELLLHPPRDIPASFSRNIAFSHFEKEVLEPYATANGFYTDALKNQVFVEVLSAVHRTYGSKVERISELRDGSIVETVFTKSSFDSGNKERILILSTHATDNGNETIAVDILYNTKPNEDGVKVPYNFTINGFVKGKEVCLDKTSVHLEELFRKVLEPHAESFGIKIGGKAIA